MKMNKFNTMNTVSAIVMVLIISVIAVLAGREAVYAEDDLPYMVRINVSKKVLTVYERDANGEYTSPVKTMACSAYTDSMENLYSAKISVKEEWKLIFDGTFVRYANVCDGNICICTAPYSEQNNSSLITLKYNRLGIEKSDSNIWLSCADAKWIFDNCGIGTPVQIFSAEEDTGSKSAPKGIKVPVGGEDSGWDPTDDAPENPWKNKSASISGTTDINTTVGNRVDLLESVKAYDICGNDITDSILVMGNYDFDRVGSYEVTYYVMDATGSTASSNAKINVKKATNTSKGGNSERTKSQKLKRIIFLAILSFGAACGIIKYTKKD